MTEKIIRDFQHSMTIIVAVLLILAYQVFYNQRNQIQQLQTHHKTESYSCDSGINNSYASRQAIIAEGAFGTTHAQVWGNDPGYTMPSSKQSSFLGGPEPPVFYDIGDVQSVRGTRARGDYTYDDQGNVTGSDDVNWNATDQYGRLFFQEVGKDGVTRYISRGTYCERNPTNLDCSTSKALMTADSNFVPKLVAPGPGWTINDKGQWVKTDGFYIPINESFMTDEKLLYGNR